jgi:hypothetical protein
VDATGAQLETLTGGGDTTLHSHTTLDSTFYINETENANMTLGLTINQGESDNEILAFKSDDVLHGCTAIAETDTYAKMGKAVAADGGLRIDGVTQSSRAFDFVATATTENTAKTTGAEGYHNFWAYKVDGTGLTNVGANANIFTIKAQVGDSGLTRWILDAEGDTWQSGNLTLDGVQPILSLEADDGENPSLYFYQGATRYGFIQYYGPGDELRIVNEYGDIEFKTGPTGTEVLRMTIDEVGTVTKPFQPAFRAHLSTNLTLGTLDTYETIVWNTQLVDVGDDYNTGNGYFYAPVDGIYLIQFQIRIGIDTAGGVYYFEIITSAEDTTTIHDCKWTVDSMYETFTGSLIIDLDASDVAYVRVRQQLGTLSTIESGSQYSYFQGYLLG